jgi:hypothetical protein
MKNYKQLSFEDLVKIETLMEEDFKPTEIAIKFSIDKSCIYWCIKNNSVESEFKAAVVYELLEAVLSDFASTIGALSAILSSSTVGTKSRLVLVNGCQLLNHYLKQQLF